MCHSPKKKRNTLSSADTTQVADTDRVSVTDESKDDCTRIPAFTDSQMSSRPIPQANGKGTSHGPISATTEAPLVEMTRSTSSYEFSHLSEIQF